MVGTKAWQRPLSCDRARHRAAPCLLERPELHHHNRDGTSGSILGAGGLLEYKIFLFAYRAGTRELIWSSSRSWYFPVWNSKNPCSVCAEEGQTDLLHWLVTKEGKYWFPFTIYWAPQHTGCGFYLFVFSPHAEMDSQVEAVALSACCSSPIKWGVDLKVWGEVIYSVSSSWVIFNLEKNFCLPVMHLFHFPKLTALLIECAVWCHRNAV